MTDPTALDRLDPPPRPPRPPRRKIGPEEKGVRYDLSKMTDEYRKGSLAAMALAMAQELDAGEMPPREAMTARAQIRQCVVQLKDWAPGERKDDPTDKARGQREDNITRLYAAGE